MKEFSGYSTDNPNIKPSPYQLYERASMKINLILLSILFITIAMEGMGRVTVQEQLRDKMENNYRELLVTERILENTVSKDDLKKRIMPSCLSGNKTRF